MTMLKNKNINFLTNNYFNVNKNVIILKFSKKKKISKDLILFII